MSRFLLLICWLKLVWVEAEHTKISIILSPRHYIHPRDRDGFFCGLDKKVDPLRLLAELSSEYLLGLIDNTADSDIDYQTVVTDAATFAADGSLFTFPSLCERNCTDLFSLILIPPTRKCYSKLFSDARVVGEGYHVMYLGDGNSIPEVITKYESQAANLKELYGGEMPHLCATRSFLDSTVATSRIETFTTLFNFPLNSDARALASPDLKCLNSTETKLSLVYSDLFEFSPSEYLFETTISTVAEDAGYFETNITRTSKGRVGLAFVETTLDAEAGNTAADLTDLLPFNGPVIFRSGENIATLQTQIKMDYEDEPDEVFSISFKTIAKRNKRTPEVGKVAGKKLKVTLTNVPPTIKPEDVWKWKRSIRTVEKLFYESDLSSTMVDVLKVWTKKTELYNGPPSSSEINIFEDCESPTTEFLWQDSKVKTPAGYMKHFTTDPAVFEDLPDDTDKYRALRDNHVWSHRMFDLKCSPWLLQNILLHEQETRWNWIEKMKFEEHSKSKKLYRVTHAKYLSTELDLDVNKGWEQASSHKRVHIKKFLSFASGCDADAAGQCKAGGKIPLKYLTKEEFPEESLDLFGTYDTGLVVRKLKKTTVKNIRYFNIYKETIPSGQREALFPVGTELVVTKFTDNGHTNTDTGTPRYEFELDERTKMKNKK